MLFRFLRRSGHAVRYVRNFTDIDDKIIARAKESGGAATDGGGGKASGSAAALPSGDIAGACSLLTEKFIDEFHDDVDALRCLRPTSEPRATAFVRFLCCRFFFEGERRKENSRAEERKKKTNKKTQSHFLPRVFSFSGTEKSKTFRRQVPEMIAMISDIIAAGHGYVAPLSGDVMFSVEGIEGYGRLSGRTTADNRAGERVAVDENKRNAADFVLWKSAKPGEPTWESPWGPGRPGWHIECSAMAR